MKKIKIFILFLTLAISILICLNIEVTIYQGINYEVRVLGLPLYLKILDFYDRHFNYMRLAHKISEGKASQKDKVMALFKWTHENIRGQPKELPVVDDHVWHIIVRGYGTGDQFSDVFTTLCNYINTKAFFFRLANSDNTGRITFSFVKTGLNWSLFEPRSGVYFINKEDEFASVEDIASGNWIPVSIDDTHRIRTDYADFFSQILTVNPEEYHRLSRANIQSPFNRFIYGFKKKYR